MSSRVFVFRNLEFAARHVFTFPGEARAFAMGMMHGASLVGGAGVTAYVVPDQAEAMRQTMPPEAIEAAYAHDRAAARLP